MFQSRGRDSPPKHLDDLFPYNIVFVMLFASARCISLNGNSMVEKNNMKTWRWKEIETEPAAICFFLESKPTLLENMVGKSCLRNYHSHLHHLLYHLSFDNFIKYVYCI